jgi:hypothetical protein
VTRQDYTEQSAELEELDEILAKLQNGGALDPEWQVKGLRFLLRRLRFLMVRETVTQMECTSRRNQDILAATTANARLEKAIVDHAAGCPGANFLKRPGQTLREQFLPQVLGSLGWLALVGYLIISEHFAK